MPDLSPKDLELIRKIIDYMNTKAWMPKQATETGRLSAARSYSYSNGLFWASLPRPNVAPPFYRLMNRW